MTNEWMNTAEAARLLGYSPQHFRVKFEGILTSRRLPGGYRKWLRVEIEMIAAQTLPLDQAS